jgi:hypothetical protein
VKYQSFINWLPVKCLKGKAQARLKAQNTQGMKTFFNKIVIGYVSRESLKEMPQKNIF